MSDPSSSLPRAAQVSELQKYVKHRPSCDKEQEVPYTEMLPVGFMGAGIRALTDAERRRLQEQQRCTCGLDALLATLQSREQALEAFTAGWHAAKRDDRAADDEDVADAPDVAFLDWSREQAQEPEQNKK